ncbi:MAG: hypothetical protein AB8H47_24365 [Bacteroidia bacterium]
MLRKLLFFLPALVWYHLSHAQYKLPAPEVLVAKHVQKITVRWQNMTSISPSGKESSSKRNIFGSFSQTIYFINPFGQPDSIQYTNDRTVVYEKDIFTYDQQQRLIKLEKLSADGKIKSAELLIKNETGNWCYRNWDQGFLKYEKEIRPDSMIIRTNYFRPNSVNIETHDFDREVSTSTWYLDEKIVNQKTNKWIVEDGKPIKLIYHEYQNEEGREKTFDREYKLQADGHLEGHPQNWLRTDIYWDTNYNTRADKFEGIRHPSKEFFEEETLLTRSPVVELMNYDGTVYRHYHTFAYE